MKQMEVTIMGQSYLLGCPEGGEQALSAAVAEVDKEMCAIRDAGRIKARERIAVLAALNLAYQLVDLAKPQAASLLVAQARTESQGELPSDLTGLMQRLDEALAEDGQLL